MSRRLLVFLLIFAGVAAFGVYRYSEWREEARLAKEREEASRAYAVVLQKRMEAAMLSPQQQDQLVAEARAALDEWEGQGDGLTRARTALDRVLKTNPGNPTAHIEMAR